MRPHDSHPDSARHATDDDASRELTTRVLDRCLSLGFALSGVATLQRSEWDDELRAWLDAGKHGSMAYLARNTDIRIEPARLLDGSVSCVMVADLYHARGDDAAGNDRGSGHAPTESPQASTQPLGRIARYARGDDYHDAMKRRLHTLCDELRVAHPAHQFRAFVDTAPVLERELAHRAGLGWIGKHTLLIHPRVGSYLLLGGVMTTMSLHAAERPEPDHCGICTRCIDACPTAAITPHSVDASRCISYLTIEHRGSIPQEFTEKLSGWIYGCDICQDVCPHNSPRPADADVGNRHAAYAPRRATLPLLDVLGWNDDDRRHAFKGSAMKRATLSMMKRNAVLLAGDEIGGGRDASSCQPLIAALTRLADSPSEDELVRAAARGVLARHASR